MTGMVPLLLRDCSVLLTDAAGCQLTGLGMLYNGGGGQPHDVEETCKGGKRNCVQPQTVTDKFLGEVLRVHDGVSRQTLSTILWLRQTGDTQEFGVMLKVASRKKKRETGRKNVQLFCEEPLSRKYEARVKPT